MGDKIIALAINFDEDLDQVVSRDYPWITKFRIISRSLDARGAHRGKVPQIHWEIQAIAEGDNVPQFEEKFVPRPAFPTTPVIVGAGPAGLFCALRLMEYGIPSIVMERGKRVKERMKDITQFWKHGALDEESNVCFGEGGAGLFSDGKLMTRVKSPYVKYVMKRLIDFGAPAEVLYLANPHVGSNKLRRIIGGIGDYLMARGCQFHFSSCVEALLIDRPPIADKPTVTGVRLRDGRTFASPHVVLATGHSAKNIYQFLAAHEVALAPKDFAVGVRVEHPRSYIDQIQWGKFAGDPRLGTSTYKLADHNRESDRGTYSFCMCPGGFVLSSGTQKNGLVTNGMSNFARQAPWSNAALVVSVKKEDYFQDSVLDGLIFQEAIERRAFNAVTCLGSSRHLPAMFLTEFLDGKISTRKLPVSSTPSGIVKVPLNEILPEFVTEALKRSLVKFNQKMNGFINENAILIAPETRTSSPLTICRDKHSLSSISHLGLYPCGEGAGYAGGITSAAIDGINVAESIIRSS